MKVALGLPSKDVQCIMLIVLFFFFCLFSVFFFGLFVCCIPPSNTLHTKPLFIHTIQTTASPTEAK